jgi:hypothetical protein
MTTPIVIETVRNGHTVGKPSLDGPDTPAAAPSERAG